MTNKSCGGITTVLNLQNKEMNAFDVFLSGVREQLVVGRWYEEK